MGQERRDFTDEFKTEAIALLAGSGRPLVQIGPLTLFAAPQPAAVDQMLVPLRFGPAAIIEDLLLGGIDGEARGAGETA